MNNIYSRKRSIQFYHPKIEEPSWIRGVWRLAPQSTQLRDNPHLNTTLCGPCTEKQRDKHNTPLWRTTADASHSTTQIHNSAIAKHTPPLRPIKTCAHTHTHIVVTSTHKHTHTPWISVLVYIWTQFWSMPPPQSSDHNKSLSKCGRTTLQGKNNHNTHPSHSPPGGI